MKWKFCLVFCALSLLFSPVYSESATELKIPDLEPEAIYEIQGQDLITLYQTINDLNETKNEWKNLTLGTQTNSENALELAKEYERENKKLTLQNNFLVGTTIFSVGVCVAGIITYFLCVNIN